MRRGGGGEGKVAKDPKHGHRNNRVGQQALEDGQHRLQASFCFTTLVLFVNLKEDKSNRIEDKERYGGDQVDQPGHRVMGAVHRVHDGQAHPEVICLGGVDGKERCPRDASVEEEVEGEDEAEDDALGDEDSKEESPFDYGEVEADKVGEDESREGDFADKESEPSSLL